MGYKKKQAAITCSSNEDDNNGSTIGMPPNILMKVSWSKQLKFLSNKDRAALFTNIFHYYTGEALVKMTPLAEMFFATATEVFDYNISKYEDTVKLNRIKGKKGGRPPKETQDNPTGLLENPNNLKEKEKDKAKEKEKLKDKEIEKPDIYIGVQDFWGVDYAIEKPWFNKLNHALWVTLDSLPLLPSAVAAAPKIKNYWVWSSFAEKEMHRLGHAHVRTIHGCIDVSEFKPFTKEAKAALRKNNNIDPGDFIIGFVFRNQLRKSVPNLLQGFKSFKDQNPDSKPKLLLHTHWKEGWGIEKLCKEVGVEISDILTTYICKKCRNYHVSSFSGHETDCSKCGSQSSCVTTSTNLGTTEKQLNEIYNLMDVYCHPFTSGGQEMPIQEAKLAGLITLVTNYSCGEEMCQPEAHSLPLAWNEYREFGTEFIKASTSPQSIADQLKKVLEMSLEEKVKTGKLARKWAIDNFATNVICDKIEKFIESCDYGNYENTEKKYVEKNPYVQIPYIEDSVLWLKSLYSLILKTDATDSDEGLIHWIEKLKIGTPRQAIESYFRETAAKDNDKHKAFKIEELFSGSNPTTKRLPVGEVSSGKRIRSGRTFSRMLIIFHTSPVQ